MWLKIWGNGVVTESIIFSARKKLRFEGQLQ